MPRVGCKGGSLGGFAASVPRHDLGALDLRQAGNALKFRRQMRVYLRRAAIHFNQLPRKLFRTPSSIQVPHVRV